MYFLTLILQKSYFFRILKLCKDGIHGYIYVSFHAVNSRSRFLYNSFEMCMLFKKYKQTVSGISQKQAASSQKLKTCALC